MAPQIHRLRRKARSDQTVDETTESGWHRAGAPRDTANSMRQKTSMKSVKNDLMWSHHVQEISQFPDLGTAGRWFESKLPRPIKSMACHGFLD
jgi:hypothetical protein